jgi:hypothetical protein
MVNIMSNIASHHFNRLTWKPCIAPQIEQNRWSYVISQGRLSLRRLSIEAQSHWEKAVQDAGQEERTNAG